MAPPAADTASYAGGYSTNLRDITLAELLPFTTVIWILALAATLPRSRRTAATPPSKQAGDQGHGRSRSHITHRNRNRNK